MASVWKLTRVGCGWSRGARTVSTLSMRQASCHLSRGASATAAMAHCAAPRTRTLATLFTPTSDCTTVLQSATITTAVTGTRGRGVPASTAVDARPTRGMAKRGSKKAPKGGGGGGMESGAADFLAKVKELQSVNLTATATEMQLAVTQFEKEVDTIRVGEISPSMLDHLQVDMGGSVPLKAVAQVAKVDGRTLLVTVFDKSMASQVEAAIRNSSLGLEPARDGEQIRISAPKMTAEHRQNLVKLAKEHLERGKVRVRRVRTDGMKAIKAAKGKDGVSKDDIQKLEGCVTEFSDTVTNVLDSLFDAKRDEIENK